MASLLHPAIVAGSRVVRTDGRTGTVSRIIAREGEIGGIADVRWDGSRRSTFEAGDTLRPEAGGAMRHRDGLVALGW